MGSVRGPIVDHCTELLVKLEPLDIQFALYYFITYMNICAVYYLNIFH